MADDAALLSMAAGQSAAAQAKPHRSLPILGSSSPMAAGDPADHPRQQRRRPPATEIPRPTAAPSSLPSSSSPRSLRRVASSPDSIRPENAWRLAAALETSADDTVVLSPGPAPDIDPSARSLRSLGRTVMDARDLQRLNLRKAEAEAGAQSPGGSSKRKRASAAAVWCRRCFVEDTPKWRPGPDGPGTLCNVCGLLYARRATRKYANGEDGWG